MVDSVRPRDSSPGSVTSAVELTPRLEKALEASANEHGRPLSDRTASGGFKTNDGTLYLSKPFTSFKSKKRKAVITFVPRKSVFEKEGTGANEFRGFFTLFWISIFIFTVRTYIRSFETLGYPLSLAFATQFSKDAIILAISDAVLVASTGLCVPFAKAISNGYIKYYWVGLTIQHLFQTTVLLLAVKWTFDRQWPWVQSGFLTLHCLVMIMKMHSYMTVNGYLSYVNSHSQTVLSRLRDTTKRVGGWDTAILAAKLHRQQLDNETARSGNTSADEGVPTPDTTELPDGTTKSIVDASTVAALRKRLVAAAAADEKLTANNGGVEISTTSSPESEPSNTLRQPMPHPLVDHPDHEISALAQAYTDMELELTSSGPEYVRWPENITMKNFAVYQLIPSLVYELEYPRTDRIRPLYIFEKTVATFGTFALLYTITETFIIPLSDRSSTQSFARCLLDLALPFMMAYILLFYIIFECICNGFAELSYFADRQFYEDWWNATSWDEFSRKWNKPVHSFLLRHVYAETSYKVSKHSAMFLTFLLSAAVHEMVMAVVTQKIRMYLFTMQLIQIPLIYVGRIPAIRRNKLLGNIVFWLGLYAGFPLLCVAYVKY
ncbi:hypothetical protein JAAARDRAFT_31224 [Jaapia argillacea MUCL 33604]|uniref:O-acyltransferase n=1 Tax=Jaapia argillacea MUCL 33604 TaxID=933084 RepID=A0A067QGL0_9AGAM|nr:hypothetical protein JAAARDRAFT_31224 [Jaapia argillacea MUCL 33604]